MYTNTELEAFARATALPHARKQVVETLTLGLCLSTQACTTADVRGGEQLSLSPLRTVIKEAEEAVTPGIIPGNHDPLQRNGQWILQCGI